MSADDDSAILAKAMLARVAPNSTLALIPLNSAAERAPKTEPAFFCVHSLSGAAGSDFFPLAQRMPEIRFYGIQAPPKCMRDAAFGSSIRSLAVFYADHILAQQPTGPYRLGGWSAGATIALDIVEVLRAHDCHVDLLVAFDGAPENTGAKLPPWNPAYLRDVISALPQWCVQKGVLRRDFPKTFANHLARRIGAAASTISRKARGLPLTKRNPFDTFLEIYPHTPEHANFIRRLYQALAAYEPPRRVDGAVVVYASKMGPSIRPLQVGRVWRMLAPKSEILTFSGSHDALLVAPHVEAVADDLRRRLTQPGRKHPADGAAQSASRDGRLSLPWS